MIVPQKKSAFTLIELIIVITIITVLTGFLVVDFNGAKKQQELSALADQAVALLQQTQAEVGAGKVNADGIFLCEGALFEKEGVFQLVQMDYLEGACDVETASFDNYGVMTGVAQISEIQVDNIDLDYLWAVFAPPNGDVEFYSGEDGGMFMDGGGDAGLSFLHPGEEDRVIYLTLNSITNKASLSLSYEE